MKKSVLSKLLFAIVIIGLIVPVFTPTVTILANSWTERADHDSTIYAGAGELPEYIETEEIEKQNWFMELLTSAVTGIGTGFETLFQKANISLNSIIYGRVNGYDSNGVALFTFELNKGNSYGLVGAAIYQIFRMFSYAAIALIAFGKLSIHSFKRMTRQNIDKIKSSLYYVALSFLLLALMPYLLDVTLYIRDVILYLVVNTGSNLILGESSSMDLIGLFRNTANNSLTDAIVYVAAVFYSLYLAFLYIGYAMAFLVCFAAFPLVVIASNLRQDLIKNWVSSIAYFIAIPVLDAGLLLVPAFLVKFNVSTLITLFSCMAMIQARSMFAKLLGLQDSGSSMMGMATMLASGRMIGSVVKTTATTIGALAGAGSDMNMARYENDMAASENNFDTAGITSGTTGTSALSADAAGANSYQNNAENIANKYANVLNFESSPLNNQISHDKKAELYRQRAKMRAFQAAGATIGGAVGMLAGGSAGLMMGPATTAMGVSAGANIGSNLGGMLGHSLGSLNIPSSPAFNASVPVEQYTGTVDNGYLPATYKANASISSLDFDMNATNDSITKEDIFEHIKYNQQPITHCSNVLNKHYSDNAQTIMEPIYKKMQSEITFDELSKDEVRNEFRSRVHQQYMCEFYPLYDSQIARVSSENKILEAASKQCIASGIKNIVFNKNNPASFVSDEALNNYSWFDM